jgi:hypothetical protein
MAILIDETKRVLVQGITGREGQARTRLMREYSGGLIVDRAGKPAAALPSEEFANKDSELLAGDVECRLAGVEGFYLELDIPGLDELIAQSCHGRVVS